MYVQLYCVYSCFEYSFYIINICRRVEFGVIEKLTSACYFKIARETMLLPVLKRLNCTFNSCCRIASREQTGDVRSLHFLHARPISQLVAATLSLKSR